MKSLVFELNAIEDLEYWIKNNKRIAQKVIKIIKELDREPFGGLNKPEPLKYNYQGCWSKRIDEEHRLIYEVFDDKIVILACRYHYDD
ncbi:MAG: addiction module toxin, Txe/YoeB family [Ignavibacteria bacterium]|nr:addiction module toxin, Txe/YoeB family [Ignavibacteria bacterium]